MTDKNLTFTGGTHIDEACERACIEAHRLQQPVNFEFNDIWLTVDPGDKFEKLVRAYYAESKRRRDYYLASPEYAKHQDEARLREAKRQDERNAALEDAPDAMSLADPDGWKKAQEANQDGYGGGVLAFAERWARMMEAAMANGESLEDCADRLSSLADDEGITGFMYGGAVSTLAAVWEHGEELRRWHNLKTQLGNEGEKANESGGVLNPALLNLG